MSPNAEILHVKNCLRNPRSRSIKVLNNVIEIPADMHFLDIDVLKYKNSAIVSDLVIQAKMDLKFLYLQIKLL